MMKKHIAFLLVVVALFSTLCSCAAKDSSAAVDTYLSIAEDFVKQGNYDAAMDILQKGFSETKDDRIAVMIAELLSDNTNGNPDNDAPFITDPETPATEDAPSSNPETTAPANTPVLKSNYPIEIDMDDMLSASIYGEDFYSAYRSGVLGNWMFLYVHGSSDPSTIYDEFWYDTQLKQMTYYGILRKQAQDAGWGDIWDEMVNGHTSEDTSQEASNNSGAHNPFTSYAGNWAENGYSEQSGGMYMNVTCTETTIKVGLFFEQSAPMNHVAEIYIEKEIPYVENGVLSANAITDSWGNIVNVQINLSSPDLITCHVVEVAHESGAMWGFHEGVYELYKN